MFEAIKTVIAENYRNRYRLWRLAAYELRAQNSGTFFGFFWIFLNPALQIFVYWFVFAIGLNASAPRGGYPYIIWMITGIIPWFFISGAMMASTTSIYNYSGVLKRMYLPLSIVPVKTVLSNFMGHVWAMLVVFAIFLLAGYSLTWGALLVLYYAACALAFLVSYALLASAVTVVFKDFQKIMSSVIRLLFYITPIVWVQENLPEKLQFVLKLNPLAYVVNGYRESILYGYGLGYHGKQMLYFWCVTLVLFAAGCSVHMKFRKKFMDLV